MVTISSGAHTTPQGVKDKNIYKAQMYICVRCSVKYSSAKFYFPSLLIKKMIFWIFTWFSSNTTLPWQITIVGELSISRPSKAFEQSSFVTFKEEAVWDSMRSSWVLHTTRSASDPTAMIPFLGNKLNILAALVLVKATNWFWSIYPAFWNYNIKLGIFFILNAENNSL